MPRLSDLTDYNFGMAGVDEPMSVGQVYDKFKGKLQNISDTIKPLVQADRKFTEDVLNLPQNITSSNVDKVINSLFRDDDKRLQLWPEKLLRSGTTAAGNVMSGEIPQWAVDPATGDVHTSPQMVEAAQEMSALAGTGGLGGTGGTLNATPSLRPALKHNGKLYKGKPGQEHMDVIPESMYPDFQKKAMSGEDIKEYNFGFINDKGHFLNREDALKYGIDNGLIDPQAGKFGALTSTLFADSSKPGTAIEALKTSKPMLTVARKMPDGKIQSGKSGQIHSDLLDDAELIAGLDKVKGEMGFTTSDGKFLSRSQAIDFVNKNEPKRALDANFKGRGLEAVNYNENSLLADSSKPGAAIEAMKTANPFFSALEHNVKQILQSKMTGDQWLGTLGNKPGVKPEELQWTGLADFLNENKGKPVTKAQIEEHLQNNKVELKEVTKGELSDKQIMEQSKIRPEDWDKMSQSQKEVIRTNFPIDKTKYHSYQLPGGPLSRDTEILTNKGWKRIDAVEIGDVVMTRKDEAGILEWQPVQDTPKVYAENLYHFFSQSINMRVTENHQMLAKKRRRNCGGLIRLTAKELWGMSEMLVPLTGVWESGETDKIFGFDPHDLAELFGWYLAEGSYKHKDGNKHTIQIAQCKEYNPEKCERIEALLDRMGLPWRYYGEAYGIGTKTMDKDLAELFHEQPTSEFKFIPYFFFNQSKSVIQSLLDGLILGDGCVSEQEGRLDKITFFTKSEQLAGDVQILILMIGKNANVRQRPSGLYCVGVKSKEWSSIDEAKFEIAPYNDFAFCVTVENHAIYVRRNGVAAFTGNSNYREMLMTLPKNSLEPVRNKIQTNNNRIQELRDSMHGTSGSNEIRAEISQLQNDNISLKSELATTNSNEYRSSHWDEPNILAHVRMNDRTIEGKKSLHLEEIQSDWHQQGREKGYKSDANVKNYDKLIDERHTLAQKVVKLENEFKAEIGKGYDLRNLSDADKTLLTDKLNKAKQNSKEYQEASNAYVKVADEVDKGNPNMGVPDAPFKKSWHELALKRMLREASEKGYDRLSWTPGEAQAARYDLSKSVDKVNLVPDASGQFRIDAFKDNHKVMEHFAKTESEVSAVVGKEVAKKLFETRNNLGASTLAGQDLKIGGEGMKGFYDKMIPQALEKLGKEHGVKVKSGEINKSSYSIKEEKLPDGRSVYDVMQDGKLFSSFNTKAEAQKRIDTAPKEGKKIHYIDIPQSLKDTATQKGFPLFSAGGYMLLPVAGNPFEQGK